MLSTLRARSARALPLPFTHARAYASLLDEIGASLPEASSSAVPATAADAAGPGGRRVKRATSAGAPAAAAGKLRPHLNIDVNPNHGLYAFFRKKGDEFSKEGVHYETVEPALPSITDSGRAWEADELRRKSFRDLHTLWYLVLRERNLLSTQREEARRMGIQGTTSLSVPLKLTQCRKTMARIKFVLNERRLAYEGALRHQAAEQEKTRERDVRLAEFEQMQEQAVAIAQEMRRSRDAGAAGRA